MVKVVHEAENKRSAAYDGERNVGECTYSKSPGIWIIDHTFVDDAYGGKGIAGKLVAEVVERAREKDVKIIPLCPFAKREFDLKSEYKDVLSK